MADCIFCKIIEKEIPSNVIYEDDYVIAFHDISPMAPVHVLVVPKQHIESANMLDDTNIHIVSHVFKVLTNLAKELGIDQSGYRIINNCNDDGGQTVKHLHFHLLGGKKLNVEMG